MCTTARPESIGIQRRFSLHRQRYKIPKAMPAELIGPAASVARTAQPSTSASNASNLPHLRRCPGNTEQRHQAGKARNNGGKASKATGIGHLIRVAGVPAGSGLDCTDRQCKATPQLAPPCSAERFFPTLNARHPRVHNCSASTVVRTRQPCCTLQAVRPSKTNAGPCRRADRFRLSPLQALRR